MNRGRGFTLLELLIGMTLLGFLLALLFGGFRLAAQSWDAVEVRVEDTNDEQLARALVRRLLTQLQPVRWKKAINQPIAFVGDRTGLRAVAPLTGQAGVGGLRLIQLTGEDTTESGKGPMRLVLRHAPLRYDADDFGQGLAEARDHTVLSGLQTVQFSYFGSTKRGETPSWRDDWGNAEQLPQLVRIRLDAAEAGWSDVIVAPKVTGSGCIWSTFYRRCIS